MISERTYDLYRSRTIGMGYCTRLQCIGQSAWVGDTNAYRILVGKPFKNRAPRKIEGSYGDELKVTQGQMRLQALVSRFCFQIVGCFVRKVLNLLH